MADLTITLGAGTLDCGSLFCFSGEAFHLDLTFSLRDVGTALDVSAADLSMTLGSIVKADADFDKTWGDDNQARLLIDDNDTASAGEPSGLVTVEVADGVDTLIYKSGVITLYILSGSEPLIIGSIRAALMDVAADNLLLHAEEFSDLELVRARQLAVEDWNSRPGYHTNYSVRSLPAFYVGAWRKGAVAHALMMQARHYTRNRLDTTAGGVAVSDQAKAGEYMGLAAPLYQEWLAFCNAQQYYDRFKGRCRSLTRL